jgi:hypothetical protein
MRVVDCLECEPRKNLIGRHGVDHRTFDNHVAVNVWALAAPGLASLASRVWRHGTLSAGWVRKSAVTWGDKMIAASQGGDEGYRLMGYRKIRDVDVNGLFTLRG